MSAIVAVFFCVLVLPRFGTAIAKTFPEYAFWQYPILVGLYAAAACFFFAQFHFWLLLGGIDRNGVLAEKNLKMIRLCAVLFGILYFIFAMPVIFLAADAGDAPGAILFAAFLGTLPIGVAAVAAILEKISN
jgi:membrane protein insertase Oxa1/YidC/SpoIIIJ